MDTEKYQGWTNYATWCVDLWLSNSVKGFENLREHRPKWVELTKSNPELAAGDLKKAVTEGVIANGDRPLDSRGENLYAGIRDDLRNNGSTLKEVNWLEIVQNFAQD